MTLSEDLADWCDWDDAALAYGVALGLFPGATRREVNRLLLSRNPLGDGLHAGMLALVSAGVVERRTQPDEQFRWIFPGIEHMSDLRLEGEAATADLGPAPVGPGLPDLGPVPGSAPPTPPPARRRWWQRG